MADQDLVFNGMHFRSYQLSNKLQVLAISDKRFTKSSAAMAVYAGSMQNPEEHLGLAHFLEHLLFLGTDDFPQVGEYEDYLNKNGGGHNAYTSIDHTNYFFDIVHDGYEGALHRFSRFFVNPTFDANYVERELNAVNSEHEKNLKDDGRREYRFLQMITDPSHPFSKFATGDKNTLAKADRDVVMNFYRNHYSSNLMRLVLMSSQDTNQLIELANKYFSDVNNLDLNTPEFSDQLFAGGDLPQFHQVETVRDQDILKISFDTPDDLPYWESKPSQMLAHLLGEEGEGSLLSFLKSQGLAIGLETSTWWRLFHVKVHLTEKGKANYQEVVKAVFSFIKLIQREGLKDYIFEERKTLAKIELDNMEPKSSMSRASSFSASMLYYPVESFLDRYYLYHKHSEADFKLFLDKLTVDNMQATLFSKDKQSGQKEPYYGINYSSENWDKSFVDELNGIDVYPELSYPEPNPYVPTDLSLVQKPSQGEATSELYKNFARLYAQTDTELEIPKGSLSLSIISDSIKGNPRKYLLAKLFAKLKREELNEWGYPARLAGLNYNLSHGYNTFTIDVSGFSQHLPELMSQLVKDKKNGRSINHVDVSQETFERVRVRMKKALLNKSHDAAYQQLLYEVGHFFSSAAIHYKDYVADIDSVSLDDVNQFAKEFFNKVAIRTFCYGNIETDQIKPVIDYFMESFSPETMTEEQVETFENKYLQTPEKSVSLLFTGANNNNGEITLYKMAPWTIKNQALTDILGKLLEQPFFTELRTHQQLGYVVAAFGSSSHGFCGLGTLIQSQSHSALDIFDRADQFTRATLNQLIDQVSEEDVNLIKASLIQELTQKPNSMAERLHRFTTMAGNYHGHFSFYDDLAQAVQSIGVADIKDYVKHNGVWSQGSTQGVVSFLFAGEGHPQGEHPNAFELIENYQEFKASAPLIQPYKSPQ